MADKRRISITEALVELKLYDSKITKTISSAQFVGAHKKSSDKVGAFNKDTFETLAKSGYQSSWDLIKNREALKAAIAQSNSVTEVEIGGQKYTVVEAIERKNSIGYYKYLLDEMKSQWGQAVITVDKENKKVDAQVDRMLEGFLGKDSDKKVSEMDLATISDPYRIRNEWELVDPINTYDKIQKLEEMINTFEAEVDVRLSISNSITYIEI